MASLFAVLTLAACGGGGGDDGPGSGTTPPPNVPPPTAPGVVDITPPTVPGNLTAQTPTSTQVLLTWNASTDEGGSGLAGYRVYRDGDATPIANVGVTNYTDTGLQPNTAYVYTVRAYDGATPANESALTTAVNVSTPPTPPEGDATPPTVPEGVTAIATSATSIQITWLPSVDSSGISEYRVFREGTSVPIAVTANTSFTDSPLDTNTTYTYTVSAVDGATPANESARSLPASATTGPGTGPSDTTPPTVPGNLRASARSSTVIRLRWQESRDASGIAEYRIYRDGATTPIATTTDNEYFDENLLPNTTYQYTVTAIDTIDPPNESAHSEVASATTNSSGPGQPPGDVIAPAAPQNFVATTRSSDEIELGWTASADPSGIASYTIYRDGDPTPVATVQTTSFTDNTLQPGTTYSYTVRATDGAGNTSPDSTAATATTGNAPLFDFTAPSVPQNLVATPQAAPRAIVLTWSASSDASGIREYRIFRDGGAQPIGTSTAPNYTDTTIPPGATTHTYTVRAADNALFPNVSGDSNEASATAPP